MRSTITQADARVSVSFRSRQQMKAVAEALTPEISHPAGKEGQVRILTRGKVLELHFRARDSSSLRAIVSSYLRMLGAALNVSSSLLELERSDRR